MRVLFVGDQPRSAQYIRRRLEDEGQTVAVAGDAGAAIDWLFQNPLPDLVVLDLMLARVDGVAVLETLRRCSGAPLIWTAPRSQQTVAETSAWTRERLRACREKSDLVAVYVAYPANKAPPQSACARA